LSGKIEENVRKCIEEKVEENGFEIEYVEFVKEGENNILRIVLDKPNEIVDVDDLNFDNELNFVYRNMDLLQDSSKELVKGSKKLNNGIKTYYSKFGEYREATGKFVNATKTLNEKYVVLDRGLTLIHDNISSLSGL